MPEPPRLKDATEIIAQKRKYSKIWIRLGRESMELYKEQPCMLTAFVIRGYIWLNMDKL